MSEAPVGTGDGAAGATDDRVREAMVCVGIGVVGYLVLQIVAAVFGSIAIGATGGISNIQFSLVASIATGFGAVAFATVYFQSSRHDEDFLDVHRPTLRELGIAVGGFVLLLAVLYAILITASLLGVGLSDHQIGQFAEEGDPLVVLALVPASLLFVGPGEELLFRGILQKRLAETFEDWGAIGLTSVVFAGIHFPAYATSPLPQIATSLALVFALSVVLGWLYARTEALLVPALVHGLYNAFQFSLLYVQVA